MKQLIGENCWEAEFDKLDQDNDEKISFEDLIRNLTFSLKILKFINLIQLGP